jgi:hypothetical protein
VEGSMLRRMLQLHPSTYQRLIRLSKEAEKDGAYRVAKRLRAVILNSQGHIIGELAKILQAPRSRVSLWRQQYQAEGADGLPAIPYLVLLRVSRYCQTCQGFALQW